MYRPALLFAVFACTQAAAQFAPYERFAPSAFIADVILVDLNDDGAPDILEFHLAIPMDGGTLHWRQNDGNGVFSPPVPFTALGVAMVQQLPLPVDLNGDGRPDLVARSIDEVDARWFRNDGNGTYTAMAPFVGTGVLSYSEAFDVDLDGDMDLMLGATGGIQCWLNLDGTGTEWSSTLASNNFNRVDMAMGDMDGDGLPDLSISFRLGAFPYIQVFRQTAPGIFGPSIGVSTASPNVTHFGTEWIDMDGDGTVELVASSASLIYYEYNGSTFGTGVNSGLAAGVLRGWNKADFDGDGDMDLVAGSGGRLILVETLAPGSFDLQFSTDLGTTIERVFLGDINGDGHTDALAVLSGGKIIAWNEGVGGGFGEWHIVHAEPTSPMELLVADVDGDGHPDVIAGSRTNGLLGWHPNLGGSGTFGDFMLIAYGLRDLQGIDAADLDGDLALEIIVVAGGASGELLAFETDDPLNGTWDLQVIASGLAAPNRVMARDIDLDGNLDIVFTTLLDTQLWYMANLGASWGPPVQVGSTLMPPTSMDMADLNGDGFPDVLLGGSVSGQAADVVAFMGNGSGFDAVQTITTAASNTRQVLMADLDGDGDQDIVIRRGTSLSVVLNNGSGVFGAVQTIAASINLTHVVCADLDADGIPDLVGIKIAAPQLIWFRGNGDGGFEPPELVSNGISEGSFLVTTDADSDGDIDIIACGNTFDEVGRVMNYFGSAYRIEGNIFLDLDGNGALDPDDSPAPFIPVVHSPYVSTPYSQLDGSYRLFLAPGTYTVQAPLVAPCWSLSTPNSSYTEELTAAQPVASGRDFGYAIACDTAIVTITRANGDICAGTRIITFNLYNTGTVATFGYFHVVLDPLTSFVSSSPDLATQSGDTLYFQMDGVYPFQQRQVVILVEGPGSDFIGETLSFSGTYHAATEDLDALAQFSVAWTQSVLCAYDPNDKAVEPPGLGPLGFIPADTERLIYRIRFQNTGNAAADHVRLIDRLSQDLDINTLQVLAWSHPFTLQIEPDRTARFDFAEIDLPPAMTDSSASQGFVIFSIAIVPGTPVNTTIENTAGIYFDLNPAIITNTTVTTLFQCAPAQPVITDLGAGTLVASEAEDYQWALNGVAIQGATSQTYQILVSGWYTVITSDSIGCTSTSEAVQVVLTKVGSTSTVPMRAYPVPFAQTLFIEIPGSTGGTLEVFDATGRIVHTTRVNGAVNTLDGSTWPVGLLGLRYLADDGQMQGALRILHGPE